MSRKLTPKQKRKFRIRNRVQGTAQKPRLTVFRSARHIYAQVIDDVARQSIAHASTLSPDLKGTLENDDKTAAAKKVGALIAKMCLEKQVQKVVFDRNGNLYHGRIRALAEAAREAGLKF